MKIIIIVASLLQAQKYEKFVVNVTESGLFVKCFIFHKLCMKVYRIMLEILE